jgi:hypothetical protein
VEAAGSLALADPVTMWLRQAAAGMTGRASQART